MTDTPAREARLLLRSARAGTLATSAGGQPFVSLITPATSGDGSILMLLSDLSEHTRHLRIEPRCAVMVVGEPDGPNVQTAPRVTITGLASIEPEPVFRARWVALHPYAAFYAGFGDFNLWRVRPGGGQFIGGFARAHRLRQADLVADSTAIDTAEASVIEHCNSDHRDTLAVIARSLGLAGEGWSMVVCDTDGFDLARDDQVRRFPWPEAVDSPEAIRTALANLANAAQKESDSR